MVFLNHPTWRRRCSLYAGQKIADLIKLAVRDFKESFPNLLKNRGNVIEAVSNSTIFWLGVSRWKQLLALNSLKPGSNGFTNGKWFIGYNFGTDYGAGIKIWHTKELIVVAFQSINIVLIDHVISLMAIFLKILKLTKLAVCLTRKEVKQNYFFIHSNKFPWLHVWNDSPSHFNKKNWAKTSFKMPIFHF